MSDTQNNEDIPEEVHDRPSRPLSRWERAWSGFIGTLIVGAGGAAVFMSKSEAGPAVMVAIGAILILMSITGSPITRARFGDNEVNLAARREEALAAIRESDPDQVEPAIAVMEAYDPGSANLPRVRNVTRVQMDLELLHDRIGAALRARYGGNVSEKVGSNRRTFDFVVAHEGSNIAVDWLYAPPAQFIKPTHLLAHVDMILTSEYSKGVIVTTAAVSEGLRSREMDRAATLGKTISIVETDPSVSEPASLIAAIESLASEGS
ncbi:hypothetical protein G3I40_02555 [Streptomyces sp. SID14478]|uniref:hypothetical protein n=1 Tax=Streptomyces sp. SID14478 TaxID=2706073 RepID=UPI0013DD6F6A|nr:hypothetical protein [Streptomyces sp. SID14478]NEB74125.1 hypothetical protein [Streptomyces sp. SID14478]